MKDSPYLTHDIGARNDPKLIELQMEMGGQGLAIWWCLVEMLWENDGYLPYNPRSIAFSLRWATAEEVQRVLTEFDLFENDGETLWSNSALDRIQHKQDISKKRAGAGRASGASRRTNAEQNPGGDNTDAEQMSNKCSTNAEQMPNNKLINKLSNKLINQESNNNTPLNADIINKIFEIFYFELGFAQPRNELDRFIAHYEGTSWTYTDGSPVTDVVKCARKWKPENGDRKNRFPKKVLDWLKVVYAAAEGVLDDRKEIFDDIYAIRQQEQQMTIVFRTPEMGLRLREFVCLHELEGSWTVSWNVRNA